MDKERAEKESESVGNEVVVKIAMENGEIESENWILCKFSNIILCKADKTGSNL